MSVSIVFDYAHCYRVVAIVRRIYNGFAVGVVSYLVKLCVGVTYSVHSEFWGADVIKESCIAEYTDIHVVVQGFSLFRPKAITTGSDAMIIPSRFSEMKFWRLSRCNHPEWGGVPSGETVSIFNELR